MKISDNSENCQRFVRRRQIHETLQLFVSAVLYFKRMRKKLRNVEKFCDAERTVHKMTCSVGIPTLKLTVSFAKNFDGTLKTNFYRFRNPE